MISTISPSIDNILIPFDGRIESAALLIHALEFTRSAKHLTLALLDGTSEQAAQGVLSVMKMAARDPAAAHLEIDFLRCNAADSLPEAILELAKMHHSEMILWAVQENSRPDDRDGFSTGNTVGEELALNATIPVMIFRADMDSAASSLLQPGRILVPLDDSITSGRALPVAGKLARLYQVPVHLLTVIDPTTALPPAYAYLPPVDFDRHDALEALHMDANQLLNRAEMYLRRLGGDVTSELIMGPASRCLLGAIRPGDLVVMTTHGKGNASKSRFGSMALRMVRSSPVPVVVLHPDATSLTEHRDRAQWGRNARLDSQTGPSANSIC